jgi:L-fuculose-phosphate aldolase
MAKDNRPLAGQAQVEQNGGAPGRREDEGALREEFVRIGRLLHGRGYVTSMDGNISARLDDERFLATPTGVSKGFMSAEQMVVIDWQGRPVGESAARGQKTTSEILLHLEAYRRRPDIHAVVHAHPATTTALSMAGISPARCGLPEVIVLLGYIPVTEYATPSSAEGAVVIRELIGRYDALVLQRHGSVTLGQSPFDAYLKLEKVENAAEITLKLLQLDLPHIAGGQASSLLPFPPGALDKLLDERERKGLMRPGQRAELTALYEAR